MAAARITLASCFPLLWAGVVLIAGCGRAPEHYGMADFHALHKVDAHIHDNSDSSVVETLAAGNNFKVLSLNVDYPDFPPAEQQRSAARGHLARCPDRFAYASTFSVGRWDSADWVPATIRFLDSTFAQGAIAVKTWKNIGMVLKNREGRMVMLDDPKLDPIMDHLTQLHIPLVSHCGEPRDCWLAVEGMMSNDMKEYFSHHPQYHMYLHPEMPSYEDQINARNGMLAKHPALTVVGAHLGSLEWNVDRLAEFLDKFPNACVDMAARMDYLQMQSQKDWQKVHSFLCTYANRVLYGTDLIINPTDDPALFVQQARDKWLSDWKYLATDSVMTVSTVAGSFKGLSLPRDVIDHIYRLNAERVFPGAWSTSTR